MTCNVVQVWRLKTAERCRFARQLSTSTQHLQVRAGCQLFGHVENCTDSITSSINIGSILHVDVELGTVDRALQLANSLNKVRYPMQKNYCMHSAIVVRLAFGFYMQLACL